jgi:hypothetical protein
MNQKIKDLSSALLAMTDLKLKTSLEPTSNHLKELHSASTCTFNAVGLMD